MRKVSQIKLGAMLSYLALFLGIGINLLYTPFMVRTLGDAEYGVFTLVNSTIAYLTVLGFGFENSIIRYTAKYRAEGNKKGERSLHGMFFVLYSIIGVVAFILGCLLAANVDRFFAATLTPSEIELTTRLMYLAAFNVAITFPFSLFASIPTAYERFIFSKSMSVLRNVLNPLLMVAVLALGKRSIGMILVATFINLFFGSINMVYCFKALKIRIRFRNFNVPLLKEISVFSFYIFLGIIVDRIFWSTGQVVIGMVAGAQLITFLNLGIQLTNYYQQLSAAISNLFLPRITKICAREHTNRELTSYMIKVGRIQFFVLALALTGFGLLGRQFISVWMGKGYDLVYYIALLMFVPLTVPLIQNIGLSILQAKNKHVFRAVTYLFIAIGNVIISVPLIKQFGAMGSAVAIAISYTIGHIILMNIYYSKAMHLQIRRFWLNIFKMVPSITTAVLLQLLFMWLVPLGGILGFVIHGAVYICLYTLCLFGFGLNTRERNMFLGPIRRVLHIKEKVQN